VAEVGIEARDGGEGDARGGETEPSNGISIYSWRLISSEVSFSHLGSNGALPSPDACRGEIGCQANCFRLPRPPRPRRSPSSSSVHSFPHFLKDRKTSPSPLRTLSLSCLRPAFRPTPLLSPLHPFNGRLLLLLSGPLFPLPSQRRGAV